MDARAAASVAAGTPYVGSNRMPLAYGVSALATATFESLSWSTVPSRPAATNIRRSVLRWSIAMIEKIPSLAGNVGQCFGRAFGCGGHTGTPWSL